MPRESAQKFGSLHVPHVDALQKCRLYGYSWRPVEENTARCVVRIVTCDRAATPLQCSRPRGHGPDALLCRQHAATLASEQGTAKTKTIYATPNSLQFDYPEITPVEASKVSLVSALVEGRRVKLGGNPRQPFGHAYFCSRAEALAYLRERLQALERDLQDLQGRVEESRASFEKLASLLDEVRDEIPDIAE